MNVIGTMKLCADAARKMAEQGYFGIRIAEEFGGLGLGTFEYCMIAEELARSMAVEDPGSNRPVC